MKLIISAEFIDESLAAKAPWFSSLTMAERMAWLDEWTEILLQNNPEVFQKFNDDHLMAAKRAAGRQQDLEDVAALV